ncbi:type VII toxin-antitoxin system HepT family RNase toxin [Clostridiisalibacter paucivorans]|uniref:type VII toxin-antitoxin system HepT family RNase toxin n=1 Tax=Clostridiisalibacter paucivorans TaxID=408753 RepID=UPI00047C7FB6|nr:DUF86 domain-containing protein [Clostridiisalibacter paucivorans]
MVKPRILKQRFTQLNISITKLKKYTDITWDDFIKDDIVQDVVEYNLFISINMLVDIATHIVSDENMGNPKTMGDAFEILYKQRIITKENEETYKKMVGFRNILSHEYIRINKKIVYDILKNNIKDLEKFILTINDKFKII